MHPVIPPPFPSNADALWLAMHNQTEAAIRIYQEALTANPANLAAALGARLSVPLIYASSEDLQAARARVESGVRALQQEVDRFRGMAPHRCLDSLHWVNFHLAYQGRDDLDFQSRYGDFVARLLAIHLPELTRPRSKRPSAGRRIRVGYVSSHFRRCTVGGYFRSWITHLHRDRFETFVYHLSPRRDTLTREIAAQCDHFSAKVGDSELATDARRILADDLDVLIYPELGMDPRTFLLAALRLAPVQCAGWGHPVTPGLAGIDYFLSSDDAEPVDADAHYHERLVRLAGLGVSCPRPLIPNDKTRSDFGLPADKTLYLCPQSLFKLHPDFDPLLARVLAADAQGMLVLFAADLQELTDAFLARLAAVFSRHDLDIAQRTVVLPYLSRPDYLQVNRLCDVMLDPMHWSGGQTSLDALACGLPLVTFAGRFMRGRQSTGMLRRVGMAHLIAGDEADYLRLAYAAAHDKGMRAQLLAGVGALFDQNSAITSLEAFLERTARE